MGNILIIGASSGIGLETARLLQGSSSIWTAGRHKPELEGITDIRWDALEGDFPVDQIPAKLSGMVYAPGSIRLQPFARLRDENFRADFELNLLGAVRAIRGALPALKAGAPAGVVLFSTVAVQTGMPMHASVAAAKGAVEGLTRALAAELAPKVRVNAVAPSLTDTPLAAVLLRSDRQRAAAAERHPLGRLGSPNDVAAAVRYLLSSDADWITGQVLSVDGGVGAVRRFG